MPILKKSDLERLYISEGRSVANIAQFYKCSENKVNYWVKKFGINKRSIAQALYLHKNPDGDPFSLKHPNSTEDWFLYGLGLGLFWGEGNKVNTHAVRLGNTDPGLLRIFLKFLRKVYAIEESRLRFGLQLFTDIDKDEALLFWCKELGVSKKQFQNVVVTKSVKKGTYQKKSRYGVVTIYFSNVKLRDIIVSAIKELQVQKPT